MITRCGQTDLSSKRKAELLVTGSADYCERLRVQCSVRAPGLLVFVEAT